MTDTPALTVCYNGACECLANYGVSPESLCTRPGCPGNGLCSGAGNCDHAILISVLLAHHKLCRLFVTLPSHQANHEASVLLACHTALRPTQPALAISPKTKAG